MKNWKRKLKSGGEYFSNVNIREGAFQGNSLSPLLFEICMIPVIQVLKKVESGYTLKNREMLNHRFFG